MDERVNASLAKIIFKNTIFSTIGSISLKLVNFIFNVYVIRRLGDNRYGQYATILAFVSLFQIFAEFGMTQYVLREIARDHSKTQFLFWNLAAVRFLLAILSIAGITLAASFMDYSPTLVLGIFLYTWMFLLAAIQAPLETLLTAYERFDVVALMSVIGQIIFVGFGTAFLFTGKNFLWLIVAGFIGLIPPIVIGLWAVVKFKIITSRPTFIPKKWIALVVSGLPFGLSTLTLSITYSIDTVILSKFYPAEVVGWYRVAYDLVFTLLFFSRGFKDAIVPSLSRVHATDPDEVGRWYHRAVRIFIIISLPLAIGGMILAKPLIIFLYSEEYLPTARAFQILAWDIPFVMYASFCGNISTVMRKEKMAARIYILNAVFNVLSNLVFIPLFGYLGASIVTVLTDLISATQFYFLLKGEFNFRDLNSLVFRTILAAVIMGLAVWFVPPVNLFLSIGIGFLFYICLIFLLRIPDQFERGLIHQLLRKVNITKA